MEILQNAPKAEDFVPLTEHQSATPASFYNGPPVLHYHSPDCRLAITDHDLRISEALTTLQAPRVEDETVKGVNGDSTHLDGVTSERLLEGIDVWVTSRKLLLYSKKNSAGVSIPYPTISLHAIQTLPQPAAEEQQGLYMQLVNFAIDEAQQEEADEEPEAISLTLIPTAMPQQHTPTDPSEDATSSPTQAIFNALSECSNLHPDPVTNEAEDLEESTLFQNGLIAPGATDGGLPPPMPGSGGWITAENMHEYFDENGNWIGVQQDDGQGDAQDEEAEALGPGAGHVRERDAEDGEEKGEETDETKWRRTD